MESLSRTHSSVSFVSQEITMVLPQEMVSEYDLSQPVNRGNLCAMIVDSYDKSLGNQEAHRAYFDYLEVHQDFNFFDFTSHFFRLGGSAALSSSEREFIVRSFMNVRAHKDTSSYNDEEDREEEILRAVDDQLDQLLGQDYFGERERWFTKAELSEMSPADFMTALKQKRKEVLSKKK